MAYSIELFKNNPIVLLTPRAVFERSHTDSIIGDLKQVFDAADGGLHLVTDLRGLSTPAADLLKSVILMPDDQRSLFRHPRLMKLVVVADDPGVREEAKTLQQSPLEDLSMIITTTLADALLCLNVRGVSSALIDTIPA